MGVQSRVGQVQLDSTRGTSRPAILPAMRSGIALPIIVALAAGCGYRAAPPSPEAAHAVDAGPIPSMPADGTLPAARPLQRIVSVHDGDTCHVLDDDREVRVRLHGIDAPEAGQPFGTVARDRLRAIIMGKAVAVGHRGQDRYGRPLVGLEIDGDDVGLRMVADGLAWHFKRYSDDATLAAAEVEARAARRGLWADREPVPPWEWRASERERKAAEKGQRASR
jgi:micrococcal nuclease